jgi:hypothetical protein
MAFMVVAGVILLLPGGAPSFSAALHCSAGGFMPLVATGLVAGFFGVIMIWTAFPQSKLLRCDRMGPAAAKMTLV